MTENPTIRDSRTAAVANLARSINLDAKLPHCVFTEEYAEVYVTDWAALIHRTTVKIAKVLMELEGASVVAFARLDRPRTGPQDWREDAFFLSTATEPDEYHSFLRRNLPEFGLKREPPETREPWAFAQRIGACSDRGTWCIYGELCAEIAVLGFRVRPTEQQAAMLYDDFYIEKLADALKRDTFFGDPGNEYSERQRAILASAYLA